MNLDFDFFSSLNGVSTSVGVHFVTNIYKLYKELKTGDPISTDTLSCADNIAEKVKEVIDKVNEELKSMREAAIIVEDAYEEVTKQTIGAVPGTDNGSGFVATLM